MSNSSPTFTWCEAFSGLPLLSIRPASSASLASVRRLANRVILRYLSSLMLFHPPPERVQVFQAVIGECCRSAACNLLHGSKTPPEFRIRRAQRSFAIDAATPRQVNDGEEQVAQLLLHGV